MRFSAIIYGICASSALYSDSAVTQAVVVYKKLEDLSSQPLLKTPFVSDPTLRVKVDQDPSEELVNSVISKHADAIKQIKDAESKKVDAMIKEEKTKENKEIKVDSQNEMKKLKE